MIVLEGASDKLQVILGSAVTVDGHVSWVDMDVTTGLVTGSGSTPLALSAAGTTDVVAHPGGANTRRAVQALVFTNKSTAGAVDLTLQHTDGTTTATLHPTMTLPSRVGFQYHDASGFGLMDFRSTKPYKWVYDAQADFGFVGDMVSTFDGAANVAAPTKITSATAAFTTYAKVGHRITLAGAGASGAFYVGTITNIDSATQVTVSPNISTTVSGTIGLSFGTDNSAAIALMQNTINNATFLGATIVFGQSATNRYGFPTRVKFDKPCQIVGIGGGHTADVGDYTRQGGTCLAWWGSSKDSGTAFAPFFEFSPVASISMALKRPSMQHCWLDCLNGLSRDAGAIIGLKLASAHGFTLEDFYVTDAHAIGIWCDIDADPTEAKDTTRFLVSQLAVRELDNPASVVTSGVTTSSAITLSTTPQSLTVTANSLPAAGYIWVGTNIGKPTLVRYTGGGGTTTLTGCVCSAEDAVNPVATVSGANVVEAVPGNACCIYLNGGTSANTCCGAVVQAQLSHGTTWGPAAIEFGNSDSVDCISVYINGGNATNDGATNRVRKPGVRLNGSNSSATLAARNNTFRGGDPGVGGINVMGVLNTGTRLVAMSQPHYWDLYQLGNGAPVPTVEGNAYFDWQPNGGWRFGQRGAAKVADQAIAAATLTLITGTMVTVPPQGWQIGAQFRWTIVGTAAAAGTAANTITVRVGTAGTTADAAIATFTTAVGTAAASEFVIEIVFTVRTLGAAASGTAECTILNSAAGGFVNVAVSVLAATMATWNSTVAQQFCHVDMLTGAAKTLTIKQAGAVCANAANP